MITEGSYYRRIICPNCGRGHQPLADALDASPVVGTTRDGSVWDGHRWHQLTPRLAVEGDIYPEPAALYWNKDYAPGYAQQRARVEELERTIAVLRLTLEELAAKLKPT